MDKSKYDALLEQEGNYEKSSYGHGEMTTLIYNKKGDVLATRYIVDGTTEYFEGEMNV